MRTKSVIGWVLGMTVALVTGSTLAQASPSQQRPNVVVLATASGVTAAELTDLMVDAAQAAMAAATSWRLPPPEAVSQALAAYPAGLRAQDAVEVGRQLGVPRVFLYSGSTQQVEVKKDKPPEWWLEVQLQELDAASGQEWRRALAGQTLTAAPSFQDPAFLQIVGQSVHQAWQDLEGYRQVRAAYVGSTGANQVDLAAGSEQGVGPGTEFSLFRGGELQARVRVTKSWRNDSRADIVWLKPGGALGVGDVFELTYRSALEQKVSPRKKKSYRTLTTILAVIAAAVLVYALVDDDDDDGGAHLPAPEGLVAQPGDQEVTLAWQPLDSEDVLGYVVYRSDFPDRGFARLGEVGSLTTSYVDEGLTNGKTYYYQVAGINQKGDEGKRTTPLAATPTGGTPQPGELPAPAGLITSASNQTVVLAWQPVGASTVGGYRIYRSEFSDVGFSPIGTVDAFSASYQDAGLTNNKTYHYRVAAFDTGGREGERSEIISATPTTGPGTGPGPGTDQPPLPPQGVQVRAQFDNNIVSWQPNPETNIEQYQIYRVQAEQITPSTPLDQIGEVPATVTSFVDADIVPGLKYYYRIKAVNEADLVSQYSLPVFGRPGQQYVQLYTLQDGQEMLAVPPAPSATNPIAVARFNLAWSEVANAERYIVEIALAPDFGTLIENGNPIVQAGPSPALAMTLNFRYPAGGTNQGVSVTHYWRVTAVDDENISIDQSEPRRFVILVPPWQPAAGDGGNGGEAR